MSTCRICAAIVLTLAVLGPNALGQEKEAPRGLVPIPDYSGDLWTRSHLAGDFKGGRSDLAKAGITIDVDWTQTGQIITQGGRDTDKAYARSAPEVEH